MEWLNKQYNNLIFKTTREIKLSTTKKQLPAKCNPRETIIKKLIDEVLSDPSRPKLNFKIPRQTKTRAKPLVTENIRLPKHLTIEEI